MAVTVNINDADHQANSQLPASTLNTELNNVLKFYKGIVEALSEYDLSYVAQITESTTVLDIKTIMTNLLSKVNNLTGSNGITVTSSYSIQHTNSTTAKTISSSTPVTYNVTANIPNISIDAQGHVKSLSSTSLYIKTPDLTVTSLFSGNVAITGNLVSPTSITISSSIQNNKLYTILFKLDEGESDERLENFSVLGSYLNETTNTSPIKQLVFDISSSDHIWLRRSSVNGPIYMFTDHSDGVNILKIDEVNTYIP